MNWSELKIIDTIGIDGMKLHQANVLNRRIVHLMGFRIDAEKRSAHPRLGRPGDRFDEALRRELILRVDIEREGFGGIANAAMAEVARAFLTRRGTHTIGGAI